MYDKIYLEIMTWGIWRSFNTTEDIILGIIAVPLILGNIYIISKLINDFIQPDKWTLWFAWRPVKTISGHWFWLKEVYRKRDDRFSRTDYCSTLDLLSH